MARLVLKFCNVRVSNEISFTLNFLFSSHNNFHGECSFFALSGLYLLYFVSLNYVFLSWLQKRKMSKRCVS